MFIEMNVAGLTIDPFTNMPIIILKDKENINTVPIWIGLIEASAIATELEHVELSRPMTHDLIKVILNDLDVKIDRVEVKDLKENTFYASIFLLRETKILEIDSRPSDAIALALRTGAAIMVAEEVISKAQELELQDKSKVVDVQKNKIDDKEKDKWLELLESLSPEDFGKYKM